MMGLKFLDDDTEAAKKYGKKLGAITVSNTSQIVGKGLQAVSKGIPNPVSGFLNEAASQANIEIDRAAKEDRNLSWKNQGKHYIRGGLGGAGSCGGLLPVNKLIQKRIAHEFYSKDDEDYAESPWISKKEFALEGVASKNLAASTIISYKRNKDKENNTKNKKIVELNKEIKDTTNTIKECN